MVPDIRSLILEIGFGPGQKLWVCQSLQLGSGIWHHWLATDYFLSVKISLAPSVYLNILSGCIVAVTVGWLCCCPGIVWDVSGNELTLNLSGNIQPQLSQFAEPLWTDPGIKSGSSGCELISTSKKKSACREWMVEHSPKILTRKVKATTTWCWRHVIQKC